MGLSEEVQEHDLKQASQSPAADAAVKSVVKMRQLELIVAIEKAGNLRKAATLMGITQPAASRILQDMEVALQVTLFERSHEGLTPTIYGREVLLRARAVIEDVASISEMVTALHNGEAGILKVGTTGSFAPTVLAVAIAEAKAHLPNLRIEVSEADNETLLQELRGGALHLVVGRTLSGYLTDDLWRELVYEERFHIVCNPQHPLAAKSHVRVKELVQWPWILPPTSAPLRHMLETQLALSGAMSPSNVLISSSAMTNLALMRNMPCFAALSSSVATYLASEGLLTVVSCDLKLSSGAGCAYFRRQEDSLSGPAGRLLTTMRASLNDPTFPDIFSDWKKNR